MSEMAVAAHALSKRYRIGVLEPYSTLRDVLSSALRSPFQGRRNGGGVRDQKKVVWALRDVSFQIKRGEVVGIIGRNGAGKSTLLKILSRITKPTAGSAEIRGRVGSLLEVGIGFHPELTGRENAYLSGAILGMRRAEIGKKFREIVDFAEVGDFIDAPVKHYSSGMYMRLAFSVAAHLEPEILLVDEVLAVGDVSFQRKCLNKMEEVGRAGRTVLFVSHNVPSVLRLCDRLILLEGGAVAADGRPHEVVARYLSTGSGSPAERVWAGAELAPGDSVARMRAIRVIDQTRALVEVVDIADPLFLEIEYWKLEASARPIAAFQLFNDEGVCLFSSAAFGSTPESALPGGTGLVRARCRIPAHLLAEGRVFVLAAVVSYDPDVAHALEREAVSFQVLDRRGGDAVREQFGGQWPGVVRPKLEWEIDAEPGLVG